MKTVFALMLFLGSTLLLQSQVTSTGLAGTFQVGKRDVSFVDSSLSTMSVDARIWYPATSAGNNTPPASGLFPVLAFGHGFNLDYLDYDLLCSHLASWGYCVVSPDVQNGFNVDHQEFARELGACLDFMLAEGGDANSDFFQLVDTMTGVLGHSMGGGASALVPGVYPSIDAVSGLAAAETNPSAITALGSYSGPYQVISGDEDNTAPENSNQGPMYGAATGLKQWVSIVGGAHCKFTDGATVCDFVSSAGSVSRPFQVYLAKKYTTAFFNYFLKADQDALPFLCGDSVLAEVNAGTLVNMTTVTCTAVAVTPPLPTPTLAYPNPSNGILRIETAQSVLLYAATGKVLAVPRTVSATTTVLNLLALPPGIYFLKTDSGAVQRIVRE